MRKVSFNPCHCDESALRVNYSKHPSKLSEAIFNYLFLYFSISIDSDGYLSHSCRPITITKSLPPRIECICIFHSIVTHRLLTLYRMVIQLFPVTMGLPPWCLSARVLKRIVHKVPFSPIECICIFRSILTHRLLPLYRMVIQLFPVTMGLPPWCLGAQVPRCPSALFTKCLSLQLNAFVFFIQLSLIGFYRFTVWSPNCFL